MNLAKGGRKLDRREKLFHLVRKRTTTVSYI